MSTSNRQWLGFVLWTVAIVVVIVGAAVLVVQGWSSCACTSAPETALSPVDGLW